MVILSFEMASPAARARVSKMADGMDEKRGADEDARADADEGRSAMMQRLSPLPDPPPHPATPERSRSGFAEARGEGGAEAIPPCRDAG